VNEASNAAITMPNATTPTGMATRTINSHYNAQKAMLESPIIDTGAKSRPVSEASMTGSRRVPWLTGSSV
jgi:hypothetical protein